MFLNENNVDENVYTDMSMGELNESINLDLHDASEVIYESMMGVQKMKQDLIIAEHYSIVKEDTAILEGKLETAWKKAKELVSKLVKKVKDIFGKVLDKIKEYAKKAKDKAMELVGMVKDKATEGKVAVVLKKNGPVKIKRFPESIMEIEKLNKDKKEINKTEEVELSKAKAVMKAAEDQKEALDKISSLVDKSAKAVDTLNKEIEGLERDFDKMDVDGNEKSAQKKIELVEEKQEKLNKVSKQLSLYQARQKTITSNVNALASVVSKSLKVKEDDEE